MDKYYWLNEDARLTLERGYLSEGETPEGRIKDIADKAEEILGIEGFSNKFEDYMSKGFYSLSSPVWANFGKERGFSISCVTGDTWVNTNKGGKKAKDIEVGDLVLTHKNRFKPVTKVMPTKDRDDIWKLKVGSRMTNLYITGDHVVLTNTGWKRVDELDFNKDLIAVNGELEYQEQKYVIDMKKYAPYDFEVEDGLIKARVVNKEDRKEAAKENYFHSSYAQIPEYVEVDEELAWAIGVWFADGSLSKNNKKEPNGIRMTCDLNKKETIVKEWSRIISDKFNINCNTYESNTDKSSWLSTNANSSLVGKFFESFGNGSKEKQLNEELLNLPKKELNSLLKGIFQDGTHYEETDNYKLTLSNPELLLQVYNIGLKLGKEMSLQMQEKGGKLSSTRHVYTVLFRGYTNSVSRNNVKSGVKFSDGLTYCPINVLERTEKVEDVYDFTVEEDHSFSVAGVVVHNCFGSYLPDSVAEILDVNSEVGMMSKLGGGTSGFFGDIRPRGAAITGNGESSGAVHFMQMFDKTTDTISQGGVRRGKFTPYLPINHGDIHEFLEIGTEGNPIQDMTYAVTISDAWMEDMINGDKEKREVWAKVLTRRTQLGYPYIFFENNANDNTVDVYKDKNLRINHSNLCK